MKTILLNPESNKTKRSEISGTLVFKFLIFVFLIFFSGISFGQLKKDSGSKKMVITVINQGYIYSKDAKFNNQVRDKKIAFDGDVQSSTNVKGKEVVTVVKVADLDSTIISKPVKSKRKPKVRKKLKVKNK